MMKKRLLSCLLFIALTVSLLPTALAADDAPPYSLPYLEDTAGAEYIKYITLDDVTEDGYTREQRTLEMYDILEYQLLNNLSWAESVEPFRNAFQDAGYSESINLDSNGEEQYWYVLDNDVFIILGKTQSQSILNEGGLVYIEHDYIASLFSESSEETPQHTAAKKLYAKGLFQGTGTDEDGDPVFDLDRTPTRAEAVTMLVRLLGKEDEAKTGTWSIPFTDVADWAKPYVGYAYANGLTTGTSATTFDGNMTVNASQYLTFVLRTLGYESGTDFKWDKAWELSDQIGLTGGEYNANTTDFTRGDVALISYTSLSVSKKPIDYSYLAAADFRSVRRQYSTAVATAGYSYEYTDLDGEQCVLTVVYYKILKIHSVVTLHNLTTGKTIEDPESYYDKLVSRSYGQQKVHYWDLQTDMMDHLQTALNAMLSVLKGGANTATGNFVNAEYLNQ